MDNCDLIVGTNLDFQLTPLSGPRKVPLTAIIAAVPCEVVAVALCGAKFLSVGGAARDCVVVGQVFSKKIAEFEPLIIPGFTIPFNKIKVTA